MAMLQAGEEVPTFELPDLDGHQHRLEDVLARGPALVVFWKSGCDTCEMTFPYLQRLAEAYRSGGWQILAVSQDSAQASRNFFRKYGLAFPVLVDGEGWPVSQRYDPDATPTLFLIGREGAIEMTSVGFDKKELNDVSRRLAGHLGEPARIIAEDNDGNPPFRPG